MCRVLIFGGTTEGRLLAEFCAERNILSCISVVSQYGSSLISPSPHLCVVQRRMDEKEIAAFIRENKIELVIDATHPYALEVTENIRKACDREKVKRLRCLREEEEAIAERKDIENQKAVYADSIREAVRYLEGTEGNILVTTGSKELKAFTELSGYKSRVFARVLPSEEAISHCRSLGIDGKHLICMQGPFSRELNAAMLAYADARWLVTKETGKNGGFEEKVSAAEKAGASVIVIRRKAEPDGLSLKEVKKELLKWNSLKHNTSQRRVVLAGIGPGAIEQMTAGCIRRILESSVLLGAPRMLETAGQVRERYGNKTEPGEKNASPKDVQTKAVYLPEDIIKFLDGCEDSGTVTVLFSGDTGFYSGAGKLIAALKERKIPYELEPGISSPSYLASRIGIVWEDALFLTAHGRTLNLEKVISRLQRERQAEEETGKERWMIILLSGTKTAGILCRQLSELGFSGCPAVIGEALSYPEERIRRGTAGEFASVLTEPLAVLAVKV